MSEYEGLHHQIEDRPPLPGEWSAANGDSFTFTDNRECFEARVGNFLRNCVRTWHQNHRHPNGGQPIFAQDASYGDQMRDNAEKLLEELYAAPQVR